MSQERTFGSAPAQVTIGMLDGSTRTGHIARFSPAMLVLHCARTAGSSECDPCATADIAYVGFHGKARKRQRRHDEIKVHVAGHKTFVVQRRETDDDSPGFYATPTGSESPFHEIFFFRHGVRLLEVNLPLGEMLVREGKLDDSSLKQGLAEQRNNERIPIGQILIKNQMLSPDQLRQALSLQERRGLRIGEVLIIAGLLTPEDLERALSEQRKDGSKRLGAILVALNLLSEMDLSTTLAKKFKLPFVNLERCPIKQQAAREIPKEFIRKHRLLPIDSDDQTITVATADPLDTDAIDLVRMYTKKRVYEVVVRASQLDSFIARCLNQTS